MIFSYGFTVKPATIRSQQAEFIQYSSLEADRMRRKFNPQTSLFTTMARNAIAKELQQISQVLDATPAVLD